MQIKQEVINFSNIFIGSVLMAFGVVAFLSPNHIATGGTAGLAIVLHAVLNLPIGLLMAFINIPLLAIGLKFLGNNFSIKSIICILLIVISVDFMNQYIHLHPLSNNLMLSTLYGGIAVGLGLGFIFKGGASAGGGTIIAKIISSKYPVKTSTVILILDAIVVVSAGYVFQSIELALWSLISIYVGSKIIDMILVGPQTQKIIHISSTKNLNELSQLINDQLGISGTIVKGNDLQHSEYKDIIFLMVEKNQIHMLKQLIFAYDNKVKMIVLEASEVIS